MKRNLASTLERGATQGGVTRRPNPKGREERSSRTARTTTRWKAFWFSEKRSPSREAPERGPWPPRQANHHLLSKGAEAGGAAEETPILSRQRGGDEECSAGNRGGELTQCGSPSLISVGLERFRETLARGNFRGQPRWQSKAYAFDRIFLARCGCPPLRRRTRRQRKRTTSPARGATIRCGRGYWRSMGVPVRRI